MKFLSALPTLLTNSCWAVNPSAADISWAASQAKVFIPEEFVVNWRQPVEPWILPSLTDSAFTHENLVQWLNKEVDNLFLKRRVKSTCDSISGFDCDPIEESRVEDFLWDQRGLVHDTLYDYRFRKTLLQSPLPESLRLKNGTRLYFSDKNARIRLSLNRGDAPSSVPLDWQFLVRRLSSEKLSRLLMAVDFGPGRRPKVSPGPSRVFEDHWVAEDLQKYHPVKRRRVYAVPEESQEGRVIRGKEVQNNAFNVYDRRYYTPGELVQECLPGKGWICPYSETPDHTSQLLAARSYSIGVRDDISSGDSTIFGKTMGPIPPGLQVVLNVALERTVGSLRQRVANSFPANVIVPEFPSPRDSEVAFLLPPHADDRTAPWIPASLRSLVNSDEDVLSKLHRDHRTWPHLARALKLNPSLVRRWLYGEEMKSSDWNRTLSTYSKSSTGKRPVALIAYALRLPKLMIRAISLGALRFAKLYVDLIAKWYTTDGNPEPPVIRQYRNQLDRALQLPGDKASVAQVSKQSGESTTMLNDFGVPPSEKRLELLRLYERLLRAEISPIIGSSWERIQREWSWPATPSAGWLTKNEEGQGGLPENHFITLYGAWEPEGLTSIDGELHIKPSTVVSDIFLKIGASLASAIELPDLDVVGFEFKNVTDAAENSFRKCLGKYRRGGACDSLQPIWRYRLIKPPFNKTLPLTEAQLVRGFPYKRVDMIAFQWAHTRPSLDGIEEGVLEPGSKDAGGGDGGDLKFIPKWQSRSGPTTVRIESMRLHLPKRVFSIDEEVLRELIVRNIAREKAYLNGPAASHKRSAELRTVILGKAKLRGDLFVTEPKEHQVALVLVPRKSAAAPIAYDHDDLNVVGVNASEATAGDHDTWVPRARFRHHVKYWGTLPSSLRYKLRSIGLDRGGLVPRGFQLPVIAQTATDASLVRTATKALLENRGRPFLSKEGIVINSDLRKPDVFLMDVHVIRDLPVEAPLASVHSMKRKNLITSFVLNEFTEGRLMDETRALDTDAKEKLLQFLRNRLESKMADLARTSTAPSRAPENSKKNEGGSVVSVLDTSTTSNRDEHHRVHPDEETPAASNEEVETFTARELSAGDRPTPSVIEALRQVAIDRDLNTIVSETLGEVEASVMDLIKDVTIIEITEDPNTGETISRKVQLEFNGGSVKEDIGEQPEHERTIAFEIPTEDANGAATFVEILVPIKYLRDPESVSHIIQEKHRVDRDEADRLAEEIVKLVENYEDEDFDALLDVLDDYNENDSDFL